MTFSPDALRFFDSLIHTPSPSGYEEPIQKLVREHAAAFADVVSTDRHGNVIAAINPTSPLRVMLAGHCDQIGLIVQHINSDGFIHVQPLGGWDIQMLIGQKMTIWTRSGPVQGIIARKAIHLLTDEERKQVPKMHDLWIDIGARNQDEAKQQVRIGDCVTLELGWRQMANRFACGVAMDDKCGLWVVLEALRRAKEKGATCGLYAVSTVQEEIGLRGARTAAHAIDPQVGIAVDVTHATDCPTIDKRQEGDVRLGEGPVVFRGPNMNPRVVDLLLEAATRREMKHQISALCRASGTDANAIQISRDGVATGLVSIPNRYMHSPVEMISLDDIDLAAELLAEFAVGLTPETNFIP